MGIIKDKFLHGKGGFMFLRSVITSQISSTVDFITSFAFFAWIGFGPGWATAVGAFAGGVVNCMVNYKFTFRVDEGSYFAIGVKFFLVWLGSLLLNTFGTEAFTNYLTNNVYLDSIGVAEDLRFTVARLSVALVVSIFWNFMLQRYFVFKTNTFDILLDKCQYAIVKRNNNNDE
jgi:putative flippase GtrA